ncbi:MAG: hypothetical protein WC108_04835 [Bacteroidales bacterium]|nr:hypothetical protein [Bacteroidales bacterium]
MKKIVLIILFFAPIILKSQDLVVFRNGDSLNCKITKIDSLNLYYNFQRGTRTITSFSNKNEIRSYMLNDQADSVKEQGDSIKQAHANDVIIDTTVYVKPSEKWINLITFSKRYGVHATGWAIQYYGYVLQNGSKWIIPCYLGLENFDLNSEYISQFDYQSVNMNYYLVGISPFRKLNDHLYLNLGLQLIIGSEDLKDYDGYQSTHSIFGVAPSQGIYIIPKSNFGITIGLGFYEKFLNSEVYKNDLGIKVEIGVKF